MEGLLTIGSGRICWATNDGPEWESFNLIAVTTTGVVLYMDEDGHENVSMLNGIEVEIVDVEWSAFSTLTDLAAAKHQTEGCGVCNDDDVQVSRMAPPVCPKCFRGAKRRRNQHLQ